VLCFRQKASISVLQGWYEPLQDTGSGSWHP